MNTIDADVEDVAVNVLKKVYQVGDIVERVGIFGLQGRLLGIQGSSKERHFNLKVGSFGETREDVFVETLKIGLGQGIMSCSCESHTDLSPGDERYEALKSYLSEVEYST